MLAGPYFEHAVGFGLLLFLLICAATSAAAAGSRGRAPDGRRG